MLEKAKMEVEVEVNGCADVDDADTVRRLTNKWDTNNSSHA